MDGSSVLIPHPHDAQWYSEQIKRLPVPLQRKAKDGYEQVWREAYDAARRAANTHLREYVEKITL